MTAPKSEGIDLDGLSEFFKKDRSLCKIDFGTETWNGGLRSPFELSIRISRMVVLKPISFHFY